MKPTGRAWHPSNFDIAPPTAYRLLARFRTERVLELGGLGLSGEPRPDDYGRIVGVAGGLFPAAMRLALEVGGVVHGSRAE